MTHINQTTCDIVAKWESEIGWCLSLLLLQIVILSANIFLNGILCHLLKKLKKSSKRPCHTLIWHQAIVNFLVAGFCQLTVVLKLLPWSGLFWATLSQFSILAFSILRGVSAWSICLLSIDRYRSIVHYSTYNQRTTINCIATSLFFVWFTAIVMGLSPLIMHSDNNSSCIETCLYSHSVCSSTEHTAYNVFYLIIFFLLPTGIMVKTYYSVFSSARKHSSRRPEMRRDGGNRDRQNRSFPNSRIFKEVKAARVLFMALIAYMLCFTPYFVSIMLSVFGYWTENEFPIGFLVFCHILLFSHTLFDPFLHGFGDREVKKLWLLTFWKRRSSDFVTRYPFRAQADTLSILSLASGISTLPTSPDGTSSLVSQEDLVSTDFLEIYRKRRSVESVGIIIRPQRLSWVSSRGKPVVAWAEPSVSQSVCSRKISQRTMKKLALRTIGEAAAALACPKYTSSISTEQKAVTELHVFRGHNIVPENPLPDVD